MTFAQILSAILGVFICLWAGTTLVRFRVHRFKALFWVAIGLAMTYAGFRPHVIEYLGDDTTELRLRLVVALLSFIVLTITLEAIRVGRMQERYAFLWLVTGFILLMGALFEEVALIVPRITGMSFVATVILILFAFVMLLLFYLSVALSSLQLKLFQLARELALTEERLRYLEQQQNKQPK